METNLVSTEDLCSKFSNDLAIYCYHTCLDELISLTTAAYTCIGEILVKTQWLVWIVVHLLVLDTLLHAILSIGIVTWSMLLLVIWSWGTVRSTALLIVLVVTTALGIISALTWSTV